MEEFTGVPASDVLGKSDYRNVLEGFDTRIHVPADLILNPDEDIVHQYGHIVRKADAIITEISLNLGNGKEGLLSVKAKPLYDDEGVIIGAIETISDITDLCAMDKMFQETQDRYTALFERSLECVYIHDFKGYFIDVNQTFLEVLGYDREELFTIGFASMITEDQYSLALRVRDEIMKNGHQQGTSVYRVRKKDGDFVYLETKGALIYKDGEPYAIQGVARDITERKKTEEALRLSESKYRNMFENVSDFLVLHDMEGNLIETNLASKMDIGYTAEDVKGMKIVDLMPDQYKPFFAFYMDDLKKKGKQEGLISILTKNGKERVIEYKNLLVVDSNGEPVSVQGSGRDITERIKAEKALKISEEKYRNILESIEEAYFEVDFKGRFTFFNHALGKNLGYTDEELKGMDYKQYMDEANAQKVFTMFHNVYISGNPTKAFDWEMKNRNGEKMYVEASVALLKNSKGKPIGFRGIVRDITERKEAQRQRERYEMRLSQAEKMEAIGTLAGGIAHDFNNMLSAIIGYTDLVMIELEEGSHARMNLEQVVKAGIRARELVAQILSFSRKFKAERESVKVGFIVNEALNLLRVTIPTSIEIRQDIGCESETVFADPTEIHQIIMNLCTNAYQAMENHGGVLIVSLESIEIIEEDPTLGLPKGPYLKLLVGDTGYGMSEETTKNIFDPFFTTKERGKGTGLGLATVHRIVSELKGAISVESIEGRGTTFSIYLPKLV